MHIDGHRRTVDSSLTCENAGGNGPKPANQRGLDGPQKINHMPQDASTGSGISYGKGPAIRMDKADHRQVWSTGQGSRPESKAWKMMQTDLVNSGRIDEAMMNDINDVVTRFPGKYNNAIGDMMAIQLETRSTRHCAAFSDKFTCN